MSRYRTWRIGGLLLVALAVTAWAAFRFAGGDADGADAARREARMRVSWAIDPSDDSELMDAATDVFVGRILEVVGTQPLQTSSPDVAFPQTQFAVRVGKRIKGTARGTVTVNQVAGTDAATGVFVALGSDDLLEPGQKVLLITEFDPALGWYQLIAADYSHRRVRDDAHERQLLRRYAEAAGLPVPGEDAGTPTVEPTARPTRSTRATTEPTASASSEVVATETPPIPTEESTAPPEPTATETPVPADTATAEPTDEPTVTEVPPTDTPDVAPPVVGSVTVTKVSARRATIEIVATGADEVIVVFAPVGGPDERAVARQIGAGRYSAALRGLTAETTYTYWVIARGPGGETETEPSTFVTES